MKLSAAQTTRFLQKPDKNVRVILVYGPNAGLVSERAEALARILVPNKDDPFSVSRLTGSEAQTPKPRLYDEASALSLGGGRRLIRLQQAQEANAPAVENFLNAPPACDSIILIEAGDLAKKSKLRALCEGATPLAVGVACYVEDSAARMRAIKEMLDQHKIQAATDSLRLLNDVLPQDRMAWRQEMDKLVLYMLGKTHLTLDDVRAIVSDAGGADMDALVFATANGETVKTTQLLDHLFSEAVSPVALVRALQRHFIRLQLAQAYQQAGIGAETALKKLKPPVFWKHVDPMLAQLRRWPLERLELRLKQLVEAEAALKASGTPDIALCSQLFIHIAAKG